MRKIHELKTEKPQRPVKVLQFGEGNFLRAFADQMIDILNEKTDFNGSIAIVKPRPHGSLEVFREQENFYTVILRGKENGEVVNESRVITSLERVINAAESYDEFMSLAHLESLRFVISNTTEAGIVLKEDDHFDGLPESYPGKLTKFLFERYTAFHGDPQKSLILLPVELIDDNGTELKKCVSALCDIWKLGDGFKSWVETANIFCSTLVDRIVTGYPKNEAETLWQSLGYEDRLLDIGEPFGLWVIESEKDISKELPFEKAGLPVVFTDRVTPYKQRKVRVLNGAHTGSVLISYLGGVNIVRDMMHHPVFGQMVRNMVDDEIVPYVPLPIDDVKAFAQSVYERFENPFIDHELLAISLNSVSKWKARILPSFQDYVRKNGVLPKLLALSFAGLLAFYHSTDLREDGLHAKRADGTEYIVSDSRDVLEFFSEKAALSIKEYVQAISSNVAFWGIDLTEQDGFVSMVTTDLESILEDPVTAVKQLIEVSK